MPLDHSNYHGYGGSSDHKALLVVTDDIRASLLSLASRKPMALGIHTSHWLSATSNLFAKSLAIKPEQIYMTSASEVTDGYRERYRGKTLLFGFHEDMIYMHLYRKTPVPSGVVEKNVIGFFEKRAAPQETRYLGNFYFPNTLDTMMGKNEPVTVGCATDIYSLCIGRVMAERPSENWVNVNPCRKEPVFN